MALHSPGRYARTNVTHLRRLCPELPAGHIQLVHHGVDVDAAAAVFAMPSRVATGGDRDGIPNVVLEAMATGLPVVATSVSGIPEAVSDGRTGLLVEPDDVTALADALERVLTDAALSSRFGAAARARITEEFAPGRVLTPAVAVSASRTPVRWGARRRYSG